MFYTVPDAMRQPVPVRHCSLESWDLAKRMPSKVAGESGTGPNFLLNRNNHINKRLISGLCQFIAFAETNYFCYAISKSR